MSDDILDLTTRIISAHVSNNTTGSDQLSELIKSVYDALAKARQPEEAVQTKEPAVPVKKSVFGDHIVCLECGKGFRVLKRHLKTDHDFTPEGYRERFGLPRDYPMVAPDYAQMRSKLAQKIGLGRTTTRKSATKRG